MIKTTIIPSKTPIANDVGKRFMMNVPINPTIISCIIPCHKQANSNAGDDDDDDESLLTLRFEACKCITVYWKQLRKKYRKKAAEMRKFVSCKVML